MKKINIILSAAAIAATVLCTGCTGNIVSPSPNDTSTGTPYSQGTPTSDPNSTPDDFPNTSPNSDMTPDFIPDTNPNTNTPTNPDTDPGILPNATPDGSITEPENRLNPGNNNIPDMGVIPNNGIK